VFRVGDRRSQQIGDRRQHDALLGVERTLDAENEDSQESLAGDELGEHDALIR
jgi:hypothetical protein